METPARVQVTVGQIEKALTKVLGLQDGAFITVMRKGGAWMKSKEAIGIIPVMAFQVGYVLDRSKICVTLGGKQNALTSKRSLTHSEGSTAQTRRPRGAGRSPAKKKK